MPCLSEVHVPEHTSLNRRTQTDKASTLIHPDTPTYMPKIKPTIYNPDGNIFAIIGMAQGALRNRPSSLEEFKAKVKTAMSDGTDYDGMLMLIQEFVNIEIN